MIYLNNNDATLIAPPVAHAMGETLQSLLGSVPSKDMLSMLAQEVMAILGVEEGSVYTTSGTQGNARLIVEYAGGEYVSLSHGSFDYKEFYERLEDPPRCLILNLANSETGGILDCSALSKQAKEKGVQMVYVNADIAAPYVDLTDMPEEVDAVGLDGTYMHGPSGFGALWVREGIELDTYTETQPNYVCIAGLAGAIQLCRKDLNNVYTSTDSLRAVMDNFMSTILDTSIHAAGDLRLSNTSAYHIKGVDGRVLERLLRLHDVIIADPFAVRTEATPLMDTLYSGDSRYSNIRISLSRLNTAEDIETAAQVLYKSVEMLRR